MSGEHFTISVACKKVSKLGDNINRQREVEDLFEFTVRGSTPDLAIEKAVAMLDVQRSTDE